MGTSDNVRSHLYSSCSRLHAVSFSYTLLSRTILVTLQAKWIFWSVLPIFNRFIFVFTTLVPFSEQHIDYYASKHINNKASSKIKWVHIMKLFQIIVCHHWTICLWSQQLVVMFEVKCAFIVMSSCYLYCIIDQYLLWFQLLLIVFESFYSKSCMNFMLNLCIKRGTIDVHSSWQK